MVYQWLNAVSNLKMNLTTASGSRYNTNMMISDLIRTRSRSAARSRDAASGLSGLSNLSPAPHTKKTLTKKTGVSKKTKKADSKAKTKSKAAKSKSREKAKMKAEKARDMALKAELSAIKQTLNAVNSNKEDSLLTVEAKVGEAKREMAILQEDIRYLRHELQQEERTNKRQVEDYKDRQEDFMTDEEFAREKNTLLLAIQDKKRNSELYSDQLEKEKKVKAELRSQEQLLSLQADECLCLGNSYMADNHSANIKDIRANIAKAQEDNSRVKAKLAQLNSDKRQLKEMIASSQWESHPGTSGLKQSLKRDEEAFEELNNEKRRLTKLRDEIYHQKEDMTMMLQTSQLKGDTICEEVRLTAGDNTRLERDIGHINAEIGRVGGSISELWLTVEQKKSKKSQLAEQAKKARTGFESMLGVQADVSFVLGS